MVSLAKENLFHEKSKIIISLGGVILSVFLIFTMSGLYNSFDSMMDNMVMEAGADLWVTSEGSSGSLHSPSLLLVGLNESLEEVPGVEKIAPLIRQGTSINIDNKKYLVILNGYDPDSGMGGPWKVVEGEDEVKNGEIIIDRGFASKTDLNVGDSMDIGGKSFKIVGLSDETNLMIAYIFFVTYEDAQALMPVENITNYFLIKVSSPSVVNAVQDEIEGLSGVSASTSEETAEAYKDELLGGFLPIVLVMDVIGVFVGIIVVGLLVFTMTIEKSREYGILKAIGATNFYLYKVVLTQALIISMLGYLIAVTVSTPILNLIQNYVPEFTISLSFEIYLWTFLIIFGIGIGASWVPLRKLMSIDPAEVFKG